MPFLSTWLQLAGLPSCRLRLRCASAPQYQPLPLAPATAAFQSHRSCGPTWTVERLPEECRPPRIPSLTSLTPSELCRLSVKVIKQSAAPWAQWIGCLKALSLFLQLGCQGFCFVLFFNLLGKRSSLYSADRGFSNSPEGRI